MVYSTRKSRNKRKDASLIHVFDFRTFILFNSMNRSLAGLFCAVLCVTLVTVEGYTINSDTNLGPGSYTNVYWNSGSLTATDLVVGTLYLSATSPVQFSGQMTVSSVVVNGRLYLISGAEGSVIRTSDLSVEPHSFLSSSVPFTVSNDISVTLGFLSLDTTEFRLTPNRWIISKSVVRLLNTSAVPLGEAHTSSQVELSDSVLELVSGRPFQVTGSLSLRHGSLRGHDVIITDDFSMASAELQASKVITDGNSGLSHFSFLRPTTTLINNGNLHIGHLNTFSLPYLYFEDLTGFINQGTTLLDDVLAFYRYNHDCSTHDNAPFLLNHGSLTKQSSNSDAEKFETDIHFSSDGDFTLAKDHSFRLSGRFDYDRRHFIRGSATLGESSRFFLWEDTLHLTSPSSLVGPLSVFHLETDDAMLIVDGIFDLNKRLDQTFGRVDFSANATYDLDQVIATNNVVYNFFADQSPKTNHLEIVSLSDDSAVAFHQISKDFVFETISVRDNAVLTLHCVNGTNTINRFHIESGTIAKLGGGCGFTFTDDFILDGDVEFDDVGDDVRFPNLTIDTNIIKIPSINGSFVVDGKLNVTDGELIIGDIEDDFIVKGPIYCTNGKIIVNSVGRNFGAEELYLDNCELVITNIGENATVDDGISAVDSTLVLDKIGDNLDVGGSVGCKRCTIRSTTGDADFKDKIVIEDDSTFDLVITHPDREVSFELDLSDSTFDLVHNGTDVTFVDTDVVNAVIDLVNTGKDGKDDVTFEDDLFCEQGKITIDYISNNFNADELILNHCEFLIGKIGENGTISKNISAIDSTLVLDKIDETLEVGGSVGCKRCTIRSTTGDADFKDKIVIEDDSTFDLVITHPDREVSFELDLSDSTFDLVHNGTDVTFVDTDVVNAVIDLVNTGTDGKDDVTFEDDLFCEQGKITIDYISNNFNADELILNHCEFLIGKIGENGTISKNISAIDSTLVLDKIGETLEVGGSVGCKRCTIRSTTGDADFKDKIVIEDDSTFDLVITHPDREVSFELDLSDSTFDLVHNGTDVTFVDTDVVNAVIDLVNTGKDGKDDVTFEDDLFCEQGKITIDYISNNFNADELILNHCEFLIGKIGENGTISKNISAIDSTLVLDKIDETLEVGGSVGCKRCTIRSTTGDADFKDKIVIEDDSTFDLVITHPDREVSFELDLSDSTFDLVHNGTDVTFVDTDVVNAVIDLVNTGKDGKDDVTFEDDLFCEQGKITIDYISNNFNADELILNHCEFLIGKIGENGTISKNISAIDSTLVLDKIDETLEVGGSVGCKRCTIRSTTGDADFKDKIVIEDDSTFDLVITHPDREVSFELDLSDSTFDLVHNGTDVTFVDTDVVNAVIDLVNTGKDGKDDVTFEKPFFCKSGAVLVNFISNNFHTDELDLFQCNFTISIIGNTASISSDVNAIQSYLTLADVGQSVLVSQSFVLTDSAFESNLDMFDADHVSISNSTFSLYTVTSEARFKDLLMTSGNFTITNAKKTTFYGNVEVTDGNVNINCTILEGLHDSSISLLGGDSVWNIDEIKFSNNLFNFSTGSMHLTTDNIDGKDSRISVADGDFSINCKSLDSTAAALFTLETSKMSLDSTYFTGCFTPIVLSEQCDMDLHCVKVYDCDAHVMFDGSKTRYMIEDSTFDDIKGSLFNFVTDSTVSVKNLSVSHTTSSSFLTSLDSSVIDLHDLTVDSVGCEGILSASSRSSVTADGISISDTRGEPFFKLDSSFMTVNHITVTNAQSDQLFRIQLTDLKLDNLIIKDTHFTSSIFQMTSSEVDLDLSDSLLQDTHAQTLVSQSHCATEVLGLTLLPSFNLQDCAIRSAKSSLKLIDLSFEGFKSPVLKSSKSEVVIDSADVSQCVRNNLLSYHQSRGDDSLFQFSGSKAEISNVEAKQCPCAFVASVRSDVTFKNSTFEKFADHVIYSDRQSSLTVNDCTFEKGLKSPIISDDADSLELHNFKCKNNQGEDGACLSAVNCRNIKISDSEFTNNHASNDGGTLHLVSNQDYRVMILDNVFEDNKATRAGGAIFFNYPTVLNFSDNSFILNSADGWGDVSATNPRYLDTEFVHPNSTAYRRDIIIKVRDGYNQFAFFEPSDNRLITITPTQEEVVLMDRPIIQPPHEFIITANITMRGVTGTYNLSTSHPHYKTDLIPFTTGICPSGHGFIGGSCAPCPPGTRSSPMGTSICINCEAGMWSSYESYECSPCSTGTYRPTSTSPACQRCEHGFIADFQGATECRRCSLNQMSNHGRSACECVSNSIPNWSSGELVCDPCPTGMLCFGADDTCLNVGYWKGIEDKEIYKCAHQGCLGTCENGLMPLTLTAPPSGKCDENHQGSLCHECVEGSYMMAGRCTECWSPLVSGVVLGTSVVVLGTLIYGITSQGAKVGMYLSVIRFVQMAVAIVVICSVTIHSSLLPLYGALRTVFVDVWKTLPVMCLGWASRDYPMEFYSSCGIVAALCLGLIMLRPKEPHKSHTSKVFVAEVVLIVLLVLLPALAFNGLGMFSCTSVDGDSILEADSSQNIMKCYSREWYIMLGVLLGVCLVFIVAFKFIFSLKDTTSSVPRTVLVHRFFGYTEMKYERAFILFSVALTGLLWAIPPGLPRLSMALITMMSSIIFVAKARPYNTGVMNNATIISNIVLLLLVFQAIVIELARFTRHYVWDSDSTSALVVGLLPLIWTVCLVLLALRAFFMAPVVEEQSSHDAKNAFTTNPMMNPITQLPRVAEVRNPLQKMGRTQQLMAGRFGNLY
ncbi:hypothetical protein GEMRC1_002505 [Eukaryota sp. GEM-RC1]